MILSYLKNTVDNRYPTDKILKRTTKMHPFKHQYLQGARKLNRRSVMRHQLPQNVLDLPQQCLFNRCSLLKQVAIFSKYLLFTNANTRHDAARTQQHRKLSTSESSDWLQANSTVTVTLTVTVTVTTR